MSNNNSSCNNDGNCGRFGTFWVGFRATWGGRSTGKCPESPAYHSAPGHNNYDSLSFELQCSLGVGLDQFRLHLDLYLRACKP